MVLSCLARGRKRAEPEGQVRGSQSIGQSGAMSRSSAAKWWQSMAPNKRLLSKMPEPHVAQPLVVKQPAVVTRPSKARRSNK